jgi:hypothetical protein
MEFEMHRIIGLHFAIASKFTSNHQSRTMTLDIEFNPIYTTLN